MADLEPTNKTNSKKFVDVKVEFSKNSRMAEYWNERGFRQYFKLLSNNNIKIPASFFNQQPERATVEFFHLKNIEFGNWVNHEFRYNYIFSSIVSFLNMNEILKFKHNIGFGVLNVAYGARGAGKSSAHFDPRDLTININRFKRKDKPESKELLNRSTNSVSPEFTLFLETGGMGAFAHEYGHFIDYSYGQIFNMNAGTYWRETVHNFKKSDLQNKPENYCLQIIDILVNKPTGERTDYYIKMYEWSKEHSGFGDYWFRQTEIFARCFEAWMQLELKQAGVKDQFLTALKYESVVYPDIKLINKISPIMKKVVSIVRDKLVNK